MRKFLLLALLFVSPAMGQYISPGFNSIVIPGWTFLQDHITLSCSAGNNGCSGLTYPTTANSVMIVFISTGNNTTIGSITGMGGTWNTCSTSCHAFATSHGGVDAQYNLTGTGGNTSYTVSLASSATAATFFYAEFVELLPPAGFTASLDVSGATTNASCSTSCNGVPLTLTATDAVVQITNASQLIAQAGPMTWSAPYTQTGSASGLALNVSSIAGTPTFGLDPCSNNGTTGCSGTNNANCGTATLGTCWMGISALAFKTNAGTFTTNSPFTWKNFATTYVLSGGHVGNCTPVCPAFAIPSTSQHNLLFLQASDGNQTTISSISDGTNTWTIPSGASTCRITNAVGGLSCAYVLDAGTSVNSLTVTMSNSSSNVAFAYYEIHRASGSWALDAQGSTLNPTSVNVPGQSLATGCAGCSNALSGVNVVIFQSSQISGGPDGFTLYPYPGINKGNGPFGGGWTFDLNFSNTGLLLNTKNGAAPTAQGPSHQSNVTAVAFR